MWSRDPRQFRPFAARSLLEAFGCDADSAVAVRLYRPSLGKRVLYAVCDFGTVVAIGCGLAWALLEWWT